MDKVTREDVLDLTWYEKAREARRAEVIELKKSRRVAVGDSLTFLFENRETVLFQIQEMIRTERIVDHDKIADELASYNALIPDAGELSATLFIEIPNLARMSQDQVRREVNRFQGLDRGAVRLEIAGTAIPGRFEGGHSEEEKMAAVQFVRFSVPATAGSALGDRSKPARLVVDYPNYRGAADLSPPVREQLLRDLG